MLQALLQNLTGTSILWIIIGVAAFILGAFLGWQFRTSLMMLIPTAGGIFALGLGCVMMGLTNGFTDHSPYGRMFTRIGTFSFIIGIPLVGYTVSRFI